MDTKTLNLKGSFDALVKLAENDFEIIVATNQKCINLGLISAEGIEEINDFWVSQVTEVGVTVKSVEVCPHRDEEMCNCKNRNWASRKCRTQT